MPEERETMEEVAVRVEALSGPDRELDCLIRELLDPQYKLERRVMYYGEPTGEHITDDGRFSESPKFTASLDAATSLFPGDAMYRSGHSALAPDPSMFFCDLVLANGRFLHALARTEAAARVSAALRARALTPRATEGEMSND